MYQVRLAVPAEICALPRPQLHGVARPGLEGRLRETTVALRQPDVRVVTAAQVNEIAVAVAVEVCGLPGPQLHGVARPRLEGRLRETTVALRQPDVRVVTAAQV